MVYANGICVDINISLLMNREIVSLRIHLRTHKCWDA